MQVIATAGHVDHGKSTLIRALTGIEPDRLAEERRRGMSIELGFAWRILPSGRRVAFVDVPGHERFVTTMLAGVGPVAAAMVVVAADEGWMPQSAEHLAALDALQVRHGLLVVTRCDLADPKPALRRARDELAATSLAGAEAVTVSGRTGEGLDDLIAALDRLAAALPEPVTDGPLRLWIDRAFTLTGAGTVVTGTLGAGTVRRGDRLLAGDRHVDVRGLQTFGVDAQELPAVARVAVNLRGVPPGAVKRGTALLTPGGWLPASVVDVALGCEAAPVLPRGLTLHIGSAAVPATTRPLGDRHARLSLSRPLPLHVGDRALLRDPVRHQVMAGVTVVDVRPSGLRRRGAARERGRLLASVATADGVPDAAALLSWHGPMRCDELAAMGVPVPPALVVARGWAAEPTHLAELSRRLPALVAEHAAHHPLDGGLPAESARAGLGLPDTRLLEVLVEAPLRLRAGRITDMTAQLPADVVAAAAKVRDALAGRPFRAPHADLLRSLGLTGPALAAAVRAGLLLGLAKDVVLAPGADRAAAQILRRLPQPFTAGEARTALDTTRRVVIPLLEHLDLHGVTTRDADGQRSCRPAAGPPVTE